MSQNALDQLMSAAGRNREFFGKEAQSGFGDDKVNPLDTRIGVQKAEHFLSEHSTACAGHTHSDGFFAVLLHLVAADELSLAAALWQVKQRRAEAAVLDFFGGNAMNSQELLKLLKSVRSGKLVPEEAMERLKHLPFEDLDFAKVDHHRTLRQGFAEVVFGKGKTPDQVASIVRAMLAKKDSKHNILVTRADAKIFAALKRAAGKVSRLVKFHPRSGVITIERDSTIVGKGTILVVSAGTSDIPVAEEALLTARVMGNDAEHLYDVGVAGIHRLLENRSALLGARVIICVAGMEGALPSVVGGLVAVPVIAVPTSVGYGASFGGVAALLGMLNSCASNVTVVNIDNGFGAARVASCINRL
jgi:pyridinium-3,5-biscarboxylic acid mononucleotide synthase